MSKRLSFLITVSLFLLYFGLGSNYVSAEELNKTKSTKETEVQDSYKRLDMIDELDESNNQETKNTSSDIEASENEEDIESITHIEDLEEPKAENETTEISERMLDSPYNRSVNSRALQSHALIYTPENPKLTDEDGFTWSITERKDPWQGGNLRLRIEDTISVTSVINVPIIPISVSTGYSYQIYLPSDNPNITSQKLIDAYSNGTLNFFGSSIPISVENLEIKNDKTIAIVVDSKKGGLWNVIKGIITNVVQFLLNLIGAGGTVQVGLDLNFDVSKITSMGAVEDSSVGKVVTTGKLPPSPNKSIKFSHELYDIRGKIYRNKSEISTSTWNSYISPWNIEKANSDQFGKKDDTQSNASQEVTGVERVLKGDDYASRFLEFPTGQFYPHDSLAKRSEYYRVVNLYTKEISSATNLTEGTKYTPKFNYFYTKGEHKEYLPTDSGKDRSRGEIERNIKTMFYGSTAEEQQLSPVSMKAKTTHYMELTDIELNQSIVPVGSDNLNFLVKFKASNSEDVSVHYELTGPEGNVSKQKLDGKGIPNPLKEEDLEVESSANITPELLSKEGEYTLRVFIEDATGIEVYRTITFNVFKDHPAEISWSSNIVSKEKNINVDRSEISKEGLDQIFYWRDIDLGDNLQFQIKKGQQIIQTIDTTVFTENKQFTEICLTIPENNITYGLNSFTVEVYPLDGEGKLGDKQDTLKLGISVTGKLSFERSPESLKWTGRSIWDSKGLLSRDEDNDVVLSILDSRDIPEKAKTWQLTAHSTSVDDVVVPFNLVWKADDISDPNSLEVPQIVMTGKTAESNEYIYEKTWDSKLGVLLNSENYLSYGEYSGHIKIVWLLNDTPTAE